MKKLLGTLLAFGVVLASAALTQAEVFTPPEYFAKGNVRAIYSDSFTLIAIPEAATKSDDANQFRTGDLTVKVDNQTTFKNFSRITDLKEGDRVEVQYHHEPENKNVDNKVTKVEGTTHTISQTSTGDATTTVTTTTTTTNP